MRIENNGIRYFGFTELAGAFNLKPFVKVTSDKEKLKDQRDKFVSKHKCRACGQPMEYIGGNQMVCKNPICKGIKVEKTDSEGNKIVNYLPSFSLLDTKGAEIASNIFAQD